VEEGVGVEVGSGEGVRDGVKDGVGVSVAIGVSVAVSVLVGEGGMKRVEVEVGVTETVGVEVIGFSVVGCLVNVGVWFGKVAVAVVSTGARTIATKPAQ